MQETLSNTSSGKRTFLILTVLIVLLCSIAVAGGVYLYQTKLQSHVETGISTIKETATDLQVKGEAAIEQGKVLQENMTEAEAKVKAGIETAKEVQIKIDEKATEVTEQVGFFMKIWNALGSIL